MGKRKIEQTSVQLPPNDLRYIKRLVRNGYETSLADILRKSVKMWIDDHRKSQSTFNEGNGYE